MYPLSSAAPEAEARDGFSGEDAWSKAFSGEGFFSKGTLEEEAWATSFRMLRSGDDLLVLARCRRPAGSTEADAFELYLTQSRGPAFPYVAIEVSPDGALKSGVVARPYTWWASAPLDPAPGGAASGKVASEADAWLVELRLSLALLKVPAEGFRFNVVRRRGGSAYAWCDLAGGPPSQVDLFARAVAADDPSPWENGLRLPAALAVGHNCLVLKHPDPALSARLGGETMKLDGTGEITLTVPDRGPVDVELVAGGGEVIAGYHADVPRPFLVSAHEPFLPAEAERFSLDLVLNVTGTDCVPVTVTATRDGGGESVKSFELAPGRHAVDMSLPPGGTGEVTVEAEALVGVGAPEGAGPLATAPAGDDVLRLKARHWFAVGLSAEELEVYREGLRELPVDRMYWAVTADAVPLRRLEQAGSGAYGSVGRGQSSMWQQSCVYALALLYSAEHPENPYHGDERLLRSAVLGMEYALRPTISADEHTHPDNRSLQAFLLTYELLKDAVEPERRDYWAYELKSRTRATVTRWLQPLTDKQGMYNADCGTSTNHTSYYIANVALAADLFDVPEWKDLSKELMRRLARHGREGNFEERQGVPVSHYTWVSANGLAEYYHRTGDPEVAPTLSAVARYETAITTTDGLTMCLFDGRNSSYRPSWAGDHVLSQTPEGRAAARARLLGIMGRRPLAMRGESLWRCAENARYFTDGEEADPTADGEFAFSHGLIVRRQGFQYGLSTVCLAPINGPFRLDPQNVVELFHRDAGCILNAGNSCHQPEAGTFFRRTSQAELDRSPTAPRTVYMPTAASIARLPDGYDLSLSYWGFNARLALHFLSPTEAKLVVTPQFGGGEEPVVFNFFPGVRRAEELTVNGPVLHFRGVTIEGSGPFQVDRDFRIWNPYQQEFTYTHKPVRCWVELEAEETFVLDIRLQGE